MFPKESGHDLGPVSVGSVPNEEDGFSDVAAEVTKEADDTDTRDVCVGVHGEEHPDPAAARGNGQGGDDGHFLVGTPDLFEDGGFALGRPGPADNGGHHQAAFVDKNDMGVQSGRFFFRSGQSVLTQRRTARSSRSRAWRSGF